MQTEHRPVGWLKNVHRDWTWGIAVALLGLLASGGLALNHFRSLQHQQQERLERAAQTLSDSLQHRIAAYTEVAFGLRSLFVVNPQTSRKDFEDAVERLEIDQRYPGIKNIAFTRYVTAAQKEAFVRGVRADTSLQADGYPDFSIHPAGERPEYFVADYLWPYQPSKTVHGLDISAQPANLASMRFAMQTGLPTASAPFALIQETNDRTGFVVRVPVFSDQSDSRFLGSVAVTIRVVDLFSVLQREGFLRGLDIQLRDEGSSIAGVSNTPALTLWGSQQVAPAGTPVHHIQTEVFGRRWQMDAYAKESYLSEAERRMPLVIGLTGGTISIFLGLVTALVGRGRRLAQEHATHSAMLLQSFVDHVPLRVFWKDPGGRYLGCNQLFAKDAGRSSPAEVIGHTDADLFWAAQAETYRQVNLDVMESNEKRLRYIEPLTTPDGSTVWLEKSKVPLRDRSGKVLGVLGVYDDVTERRNKDEELLQHRSNLEHLVQQRTQELQQANHQLHNTQIAMNGVGIGIYWVDIASARVRDANHHAAALAGQPLTQLTGMPWSDVMPALGAEGFAHLVERARRSELKPMEHEQVLPDGNRLSLSTTAYYQNDEGSGSGQLIVFVTDITARKHVELELERAKLAAEAADQAKSTFLANMSHEIRTPLNAITGMAHLLRRSNLSPEQEGRLAKLIIASDHLINIINSILEISKIEAGKFSLEYQPVHVKTLMKNVADMLHDRAHAKRLTITIQAEGVPESLEGDYTRLQQCLINYAVNAIKFSDAGEVAMRAKVEHLTDAAALLRFEVEDQGIGIEAEALARLFNAFEQADNSITRKYGGSGLGLAITRKLAELMGGEAGASSLPGRGSTFWFTCLLKKAGVQAIEKPASPDVPVEDTLRGRFGGCQVLLAEDDAFNQEVGTLLLEQVGLQVEVAEDGLAALARCTAKHYDLVLMDMHMPRLSGIEATRRIRQLADYAQVPILAMTANSFSDDRTRCLESGMNDFVAKPVEPKVLYAKLLHWLEAGASGSQKG